MRTIPRPLTRIMHWVRCESLWVLGRTFMRGIRVLRLLLQPIYIQLPTFRTPRRKRRRSPLLPGWAEINPNCTFTKPIPRMLRGCRNSQDRLFILIYPSFVSRDPSSHFLDYPKPLVRPFPQCIFRIPPSFASHYSLHRYTYITKGMIPAPPCNDEQAFQPRVRLGYLSIRPSTSIRSRVPLPHIQ